MQTQNASLAVLFADVCGSTTLYEKLGDAHALQLVGGAIALLRQLTEKHGGRAVKTIGDELMSVFPRADQALYAAAAMQTRIDAVSSVDDTRVRIRVAFHHGAVIEEDGDVFGDCVNVAARLAGIARAGQVLTSEDTVTNLPLMLRGTIRPVESVTVRGRREAIGVCEVLWNTQDQDRTVVAASVARATNGIMPLRLQLATGMIELPPDSPAARIGRDPTAAIVVNHSKVSRDHAHIECRRGRFVLVDHSTNGSFVHGEGADEILVKREDFVLAGSGEIRLGHASAEGMPADLRFSQP
jgi:class 3 adenylate cyclase